MVDQPERVRIVQELLDRGVVTSLDEARELLDSDYMFRRGVELRAAVARLFKRAGGLRGLGFGLAAGTRGQELQHAMSAGGGGR